jgi:hypothetical protein
MPLPIAKPPIEIGEKATPTNVSNWVDKIPLACHARISNNYFWKQKNHE